MKTNYIPEIAVRGVKYATEEVDGLTIAYREAGKPQNPKLVLLHGFPSSSHQYRNLIPALADQFHVISPDYPGFGNSQAPDPRDFAYTFDHLSEITGKFLRQKGFDRFGLYAQDYGGPVGFRIVTKAPDMLEWLIIQNTNAYRRRSSSGVRTISSSLAKAEKPIWRFCRKQRCIDLGPGTLPSKTAWSTSQSTYIGSTTGRSCDRRHSLDDAPRQLHTLIPAADHLTVESGGAVVSGRCCSRRGRDTFIASAITSVYLSPAPVLNRTTRSVAFKKPDFSR
jgi:pimeloyl-ACP methyl ester carboxylesterase